MNASPFALSASRGLFVTGTDTGVGKTHVCCLLIEAFRKGGLCVAAMKPVAAGVEADGVNEDVRRLMAVANAQANFQDINPYCFESPIAPHLAASRAGVQIDLEVIASAYARLRSASDVVVVEGAGGFLVPLDEKTGMDAIPARLELPVVLVVGLKLGCINHALLTCEAIARRGLVLAGWVANVLEPEMEALEENIRTLKVRINAPCLGVVGWGTSDPQAGVTCLDINKLANKNTNQFRY